MSASGRTRWLGELGSGPFLLLAVLALTLCVTGAFDRPAPVAPPGAGEYLRMSPRFYLVRGEEPRLVEPAAALHAARPAEARMEEGPDGGVRIEIEALTPPDGRHDWDIQLALCAFPVGVGERFRVTWEARADRARNVVVQVCQSASPWGNLGYYQTVELDRSWRPESVEFEASQADPEARLVVNLGAAQASVEIRDVVVRRMNPAEKR